MLKRTIGAICIILALCVMLTAVSYAAEKEGLGTKMKNFWQRLFNYPANVTEKSVGVVSDTAVKGTNIVTTEVKTVGQVTSGDVAKTKELVTEPITGTAEMTKKAVEGTVAIPSEAAKEETTQPGTK